MATPRPSSKGDPNAVSCTNDCRKIIDGFKAKGVEAIMMDLRSNGGGLLNEAVSLSGLFVDKGPIVQVRKSPTASTNSTTRMPAPPGMGRSSS